MEVGVCDNVSFCFEGSLVVSFDDRRGVSGLGPLIDGGCGLDNFDRTRCGETSTSTLEVEETTSAMCLSSATASEYK